MNSILGFASTILVIILVALIVDLYEKKTKKRIECQRVLVYGVIGIYSILAIVLVSLGKM